MPRSHRAHADEPVRFAYVPLGQIVQDVAHGGQITFAKRPKGHSVHTPKGAKPSRYVPGGHHWVGVDEGTGDGTGVGSADGTKLGSFVGASDGKGEGTRVGNDDGAGVGVREGSIVGAAVIVGRDDGRTVGRGDGKSRTDEKQRSLGENLLR